MEACVCHLRGCASSTSGEELESLHFSGCTHCPPSSTNPLGQKHPATHTSMQAKALPTQVRGQALPHSLKTLPGGRLGGGKVGGGRVVGGGGGIAGREGKVNKMLGLGLLHLAPLTAMQEMGQVRRCDVGMETLVNNPINKGVTFKINDIVIKLVLKGEDILMGARGLQWCSVVHVVSSTVPSEFH